MKELSFNYEWFPSGVSIGSGDTITLDPSLVQPGQSVSCEASTVDGYGASASESTSITVGGFAPVISSISITPDPAYNDPD